MRRSRFWKDELPLTRRWPRREREIYRHALRVGDFGTCVAVLRARMTRRQKRASAQHEGRYRWMLGLEP